MQIRPKYSATVAFAWQEDKDEAKQTNVPPHLTIPIQNLFL